MKYLLDTNICIYFLKGKFDIDQKILSAGLKNCCISEITLAELKFGAENSGQILKNRQTVLDFQNKIQIIPIAGSLDYYAVEKARLRKAGTPLDDFDLLIGATAVSHNMIMVTNNLGHFERIDKIKLEDWTKSN